MANLREEFLLEISRILTLASKCARAGDLSSVNICTEAVSSFGAHADSLPKPPKPLPTTCAVRLISYGPKKIHVIKAVRLFYKDHLGIPLGLKEAKEQVEAIGALLTMFAPGDSSLMLKPDQAQLLKQTLEAQGAEAIIEPYEQT